MFAFIKIFNSCRVNFVLGKNYVKKINVNKKMLYIIV